MPRKKPPSRPERFAWDLAETAWQATALLAEARFTLPWPLTCWDDLLLLPDPAGLPPPLAAGVQRGQETRRLLEEFARKWKLPADCLPALFECVDLGPGAWEGKLLPFVAAGQTGDSQSDWAEALAAAAEEYQRWRATTLQARDSAGRPVATGYFSDQAELLSALRLTAALLRRQGKRVTQENLAAYLHQARPDLRRTNTRQLRRWLRRYNLDWETVRRLLSSA